MASVGAPVRIGAAEAHTADLRTPLGASLAPTPPVGNTPSPELTEIERQADAAAHAPSNPVLGPERGYEEYSG